MKTRHQPGRGFADPSKLPTGPTGLPCCRYCGTEVKRPRKTFCSDDCIHEWKIRSQPGYAAKYVLERDCGVCRQCGLDCIVLLQELKRLRASERLRIFGAESTHVVEILAGDATALPYLTERLDQLGLTGARRRLTQRLWDVDHIKPVSEGGGACGLDNLRTLCWRCHVKETTKLAGRRASSRRESIT